MSRKRPGSDAWEDRYLTRGQELPQFPIIRNGFEFGGGVRPDDTVLNQAYGCLSVGEPFRAWVLPSEDAVDTWDMVTMAHDGGVNPFIESGPLRLPGGRIFALVRNASASKRIPLEDKYLWQTHSDDGGRTWAPPRRTTSGAILAIRTTRSAPAPVSPGLPELHRPWRQHGTPPLP